jgi:hypothetical protein
VTRLTDERIAQLVTQLVPELASPVVARRYGFGASEAVVLSPVGSAGPSAIAHAFVLLDPKGEAVELALWVEENRLASFTGVGLQRLVRLRQRRRTAVDASSQWTELGSFMSAALAEAQAVTGAEPDDRDATDEHADGAEEDRAPPPPDSERPASRPPPSSLRIAASRAYRSRAFRPVAAGVGGLGIVLLVLEVGIKLALIGVRHGNSGLDAFPPGFRAGGPDAGLGDSIHGRDDTRDPIAIDASDVYWVSKREERLLAQSIASGHRRVVAERVHNPTGIALDRDRVYVTCNAGRTPGRSAMVLGIPKGGGEPVRLDWAMVAVAAPVVHEGYLYYLDGIVLAEIGTSERRDGLTQISRVPLAGGRSQIYLRDVELAPALAVSDTKILWLPWAAAEIQLGPIARAHPDDREPWTIRLPFADPSAGDGRATDGDGGVEAGDGGAGHRDGGVHGGDADRRGVERGDGGPLRASARTAASRPTAHALALAGETTFVTIQASEDRSLVYQITPDGDEPTLVLAARGRIRDLVPDDESLWWVEEGAEPSDAHLCGAIAAAPSATAAVARAPAAAGPPPCAAASHGAGLETFLVTEHLPRGAHLAVGSSRLYWTTGSGVGWASKEERATLALEP